MELFKISEANGKVYVKMLVYNEHIWQPWRYEYVAINGYPTEYVRYAAEFMNVGEAEEWIKKNTPS
jgi:hypothetical protein